MRLRIRLSPFLAIAALAALLGAATPAAAQIDARLFRYPDVSAKQIVFVYGNDVWVVPRTGGVAQRLTTPPGEEMFPRFSPDGSRIAFTGDYDGNEDVYVMPVGGGLPVRVTHHPSADRLVDWYPSGDSLLFASGMTSEKDRFNKLFSVPPGGGLPQQLPLPWAEYGAISPDGHTLAYLPHWRDFRTWKRYRGGLVTNIWLFDLRTHQAKEVPGKDSNDTDPMWHGTTLYFVSDRGPHERANIWSYNTRNGRLRQVTHFEDYDIHFPAMGPDAMVFEQGGKLWLMDMANEQAKRLDVEVVTDLATVRPKAEDVGDQVMSYNISPTGKRAVFGARGDVFTVPAEHGVTLSIVNTSSNAARTPAWSPDGKSIAYWDDASGEYELTIAPADGTGQARTVTKLGPGFRYSPYWSPDSKKIVYVDKAMRVQLVDVATGHVQQIGRGHYWYQGALANFHVTWSADSRWVAWGGDLPSRTGAVFVYDTKENQQHQVTDGFYNADDPAFDPDGNYLYFLTDRGFGPLYGSLDNTWIYANTTVVAAMPLRKDVPSPLAPRNDEEAAESAKADTSAKASEKGEEKGPQPVTIDFDGLESRAVALPPERGNYSELRAVSGKVLYIRRPRTGAADRASHLAYWDLKDRKEETVLEDASGYEVSADGKKLLASSHGKYAIVDIKPGQKMDKPLDLSGMVANVDPRAEWHQMFTDAWRFYRDYFYNPEMNGVDWNAMRERYGKLLDDCITRTDVNYVIGDLIGELSNSHTYRGGGELQKPKRRNVGLLGIDWDLSNGAYRVKRIIEPAPWAASEVRSPFRQPDVNVNVGDYILAVNGQPIDAKEDPWAAFQGLAGRTVTLTVNSKPGMDGARTVLVKTLNERQDARLRNLAWIEANRKRVDEATKGQVGYIYVPDTGVNGQNELYRQFMGQFHKPGLIIDERFNSGGQIPDRFIELLNRPITNFWAVRDGSDWQWPPAAHNGPEVMLINEWSGSGGDAFPWLFRHAGLGPLIGKRTWGGLIGISGVPRLVDGGAVTVPTFAIYSTDGKWIVENKGVSPDIEVEEDPSKLAQGIDPQLEAGISEALKQLRQHPPVVPKRPAYPDKAPPEL
jgi:tricorn protease